MYVGSMDGNRLASRMVPADGDYIIRVYQMGNAADSNRTNSFTLKVRVSGSAYAALPRSEDATLRGTP
jgi:hypothetical protein